MKSYIELRVSLHAVASFFLMNLLLTRTTFADRFKTSFMHEIRREPAAQHLSVREDGTPIQHMQPSNKQAPTGSETWFPETALYRKKYSVGLSSADLKADHDFTWRLVPDLLSPRRVLRDVSPPGMWPPGTDSPPSESFMEFARRRLLQLSAADNRRKFREEVVITLSSSPRRCLDCDTSPPGKSAISDTPPSEEFGRSRSLPKLSAPDFRSREHTVSLKQGADAHKSTKSPLSCAPGLCDSQPSEFASRRPPTGPLTGSKGKRSQKQSSPELRVTFQCSSLLLLKPHVVDLYNQVLEQIHLRMVECLVRGSECPGYKTYHGPNGRLRPSLRIWEAGFHRHACDLSLIQQARNVTAARAV